ncbi:MAG TPA: DHA2 family efflux MFS transporter permease subunit [Rhizomicrobium sp.]|nr:DHA2 family efflux MFS transporter permease subunit [Rhizomicrobium sp.]
MVRYSFIAVDLHHLLLAGLPAHLTRLLTMRWLFVVTISAFTLASIGCASSGSFFALTAWRVLQGFSGGTLIPAVFSAVFLLFPHRLQGIATTIAGVLAVLAPTVGPIVGGWITQTYSWHWLFLINVAPGILSAAVAARFLPMERPVPGEAGALDILSMGCMAVALATLEIALKEAPRRGWLSPLVCGLLAVSVASGVAFARRSLGRRKPFVDLRTLKDPAFAVGCLLSFVLGIGLFGSVYMMPVFLAFVRGHGALEIGGTMLVTGVAQLATAPAAVALERRMDARLLTAAGFAVFALGMEMSAFQTPKTDFAGMLWPQIVRGAAIMFCLLPPTRLALGHLPPVAVPDASGLFNLMRNLGGAIGIALIDSVIYGRVPAHAQAIVHRLMAGDIETARFVGIPLQLFRNRPAGSLDPDTQSILEAMVNHAAFVRAMNDAWTLAAALTLAALFALPFARVRRKSPGGSDQCAKKIFR